MLAELTVKDFLDKVAGSEPVPGGGSVAALNGALACALSSMVVHLTTGKKEYQSSEQIMQLIRPAMVQKREDFVALIDKDAEAYNEVFTCFKLPKATEEEKAARSAAIQEATKHAALVPMEVARLALEIMKAIVDIARCGNRNAVTDACVAMMCARSAVLGALLNVRINLSSLKDEKFVSELQAEANAMEKEACLLEENLLQEVTRGLRV